MTALRFRDFAFGFALTCLTAYAAAGERDRGLAPTDPPGPLDRAAEAPQALARAALPPALDPAGLGPGRLDPAPVGSIPPGRSPEAAPQPVAATPVPSPAALLFQKGDVAGLETLAHADPDPIGRLALQWAALRADPHPAYARLVAFAEAHPGWPGGGWIRYQQEADLAVHPEPPAAVAAIFAADPPQSPAGVIAAARAAAALGRRDEAAAIVRAAWRAGAGDGWSEAATLREFGAGLTRDDHKARADRLLYSEKFAAALRAAALAGPDVARLALARFAAARGPLAVALIAAVPPALKDDPGFLFARVQDARRSSRAVEAAALLAKAPADPALLVNPDRWWSERRMVARQLLDFGAPKLAYAVAAGAARPNEPAARVDAAFHAGWIALRFLDDPTRAAAHFRDAAAAAESPLSIARAAYWQGRAAEAAGEAEEARRFYARAAANPIAYYGQLAAEKLGETRLTLRAPRLAAVGEVRDQATRAVDFLYGAGLDALATPLAYEAARRWTDEAQLAALAEVVARRGDPSTQVTLGKIATLRGFAFDDLAFPTRGLPGFAPLTQSADLASVYAVARQESEFSWRAASGAGAKGLMQMLPSTAASTARRAGVAFSPQRLIADPAFNTQLGAAFLGQLIADSGGSLPLAFAAYNAGGGRVAQWLAAYGDPRKGSADPVDWVERIPFDETRDYVQRVSENLGVYRQRLAAPEPATAMRLARE